jgi:hypothetical protein
MRTTLRSTRSAAALVVAVSSSARIDAVRGRTRMRCSRSLPGREASIARGRTLQKKRRPEGRLFPQRFGIGLAALVVRKH